jgi:plastocyanin
MRGLRGAALVAVLFVAAACSSSSSSPAATATGTVSSPAASTGGGGGGSSEATITAADFAFDPSSVDVSSGKVTVTVTNDDSTAHTFTLDDGSSDTEIAAGETETIELDLSETVDFHCSIHPSMTGTLNVI